MSDLVERIDRQLKDGYRLYSEVEPLLIEARAALVKNSDRQAPDELVRHTGGACLSDLALAAGREVGLYRLILENVRDIIDAAIPRRQ